VKDRSKLTKTWKNRQPHEFSREQKEYIYKRDDGKCRRCPSKKRLQYDHKNPIFLGGTNKVRNGQLLCYTCHRKKSNKELSIAMKMRYRQRR
jgi:5-methylcytosine-specific restriction endonuclease McrA